MALQLSNVELRAACATLRAYLQTGDADIDIAAKMGLVWEEFVELKKALFDQERVEVSKKSVEDVYTDYRFAQARNAHDLTDMIERFKETKQGTALVSAIKLRSEISDKLIKVGQEFGIIKLEPKKQVLGILVQDMTSNQLQGAVKEEMMRMQAITRSYGEASDILDVDPGETHYQIEGEYKKPVQLLPAPSQADQPIERPKPHFRSKVGGGRRVVR